MPPWVEGGILPPFDVPTPSGSRDVYALQSKGTKENEPILRATAMLVRDNFKLTRFWGYEQIEEEIIELYDLDKDPQELDNLYPREKEQSSELMGAVLAKLDEVERRRKESIT